MPFYDHEIDLVILTHPHADHYVGLTALLNRYKVDRLLWNGVKGMAPDYQPFQAAVDKKHVVRVVDDHKISFDFGDGVHLTTIYPNRKLGAGETADPNVTSIISRLEYGSNSVLLTGDTSEAVEQGLVASHLIRPDTVLKVAHHGSKTGTDAGFLATDQPKFAVISVGRNNRYGHPAPETLLRLKGIQIYRTDKDGTVEFSSKAGVPFSVKAHALHD
jgi:competence protein ComEC